MDKRKIAFLFVFICCVLSWGASAPLYSIELPSINKSKIRLTIAPGRSAFGEITVENQTAQERSMKVYLSDWRYLPASDGTKEFLPVNTTPVSCGAWITFTPSEFTIRPFGKQKINYEVRVPPDANGGHYAAMFFESVFGRIVPAADRMSAGMNLAIRIATLFYIEPEGTVQRSARIENVRFSKSAGGVVIQADFKNTGTVDITTEAAYHIIDAQGMVYSRGSFDPVYTFPDGEVTVRAPVKERVPAGKYDLVLTFDLGKALEEYGLGRGPVITHEIPITVATDGSLYREGSAR